MSDVTNCSSETGSDSCGLRRSVAIVVRLLAHDLARLRRAVDALIGAFRGLEIGAAALTASQRDALGGVVSKLRLRVEPEQMPMLSERSPPRDR